MIFTANKNPEDLNKLYERMVVNDIGELAQHEAIKQTQEIMPPSFKR